MEKNKNKIIEEQPFLIKLKNYIKNLFDFSKYKKTTIIYIVLFVILIGFSLFLLYYNYFIDNVFLYRLVVEWFVNPIYLLGIIGIFLFLAIMAIQGLLVPIPSEIILFATGMIWGWIIGGLMGIIGSMGAALLCFYISKKGGRPLAEKFIGESAISMADNLIQKYGYRVIIIARFIPIISFDIISYTSGLVDMDAKKYTLGTLIGSIPRAFFWSWLGDLLPVDPPINLEDLTLIYEQALIFNNILLLILGTFLIMFLINYLLSIYWKKKGKNKN